MNRSEQSKQMMKCGGKTKKMAKGGKTSTKQHCRGGGAAVKGTRFCGN